MISKEKLAEIVQKSVEDAWYDRRSLNPVKEQTEIITNAILEQLNEPDVSIALPTQAELQETIEKIAYNQLAEEQVDDLVCKMQILDEFVKKYLKTVGNEC